MIDDRHSWRLPDVGVGTVRRDLEDVCAILDLEPERSHGELVGEPKVRLKTATGETRRVDMPPGEMLPRIC